MPITNHRAGSSSFPSPTSSPHHSATRLLPVSACGTSTAGARGSPYVVTRCRTAGRLAPPDSPRVPMSTLCSCKCLFDIVDDVVAIFDADGKADRRFVDAVRQAFLRRELLVRGRCRMDHQRLCVAHVG